VAGPARARRYLLNAIIAVHVFVIAFLGLPLDFPGREAISPVVEAYAYPLGLWQSWKMFAPTPPNWNSTIAAVLEWKDGHRSVFPFPAVREMDRGQALVQARFQTWEGFLLRSSSAFLLRDAALWVARMHDPSGTSVARVTLVERDRRIPQPGQPAPPAETLSIYTMTHR
jgi:hypothetical protein